MKFILKLILFFIIVTATAIIWRSISDITVGLFIAVNVAVAVVAEMGWWARSIRSVKWSIIWCII